MKFNVCIPTCGPTFPHLTGATLTLAYSVLLARSAPTLRHTCAYSSHEVGHYPTILFASI